MSINISSGPAQIVGHGSVTAFLGQPLRFELAQLAGGAVVEMAFLTDPEIEDVAVQTSSENGLFRLDLTNFDRADGRGSAIPVLLGRLGEQLLFLHFRVFRYGKTDDRTVHYTFFLADQTDLGWEEVHDSHEEASSTPDSTSKEG